MFLIFPVSLDCPSLIISLVFSYKNVDISRAVTTIEAVEAVPSTDFLEKQREGGIWHNQSTPIHVSGLSRLFDSSILAVEQL